jgi:hypothetical protein
MDYGIWGLGTALIGMSSLLIGLFMGYRWGKADRRQTQPAQEPVTRVMEAVNPPTEEQPPPEKTLLERQVDEIMKKWH